MATDRIQTPHKISEPLDIVRARVCHPPGLTPRCARTFGRKAETSNICASGSGLFFLVRSFQICQPSLCTRPARSTVTQTPGACPTLARRLRQCVCSSPVMFAALWSSGAPATQFQLSDSAVVSPRSAVERVVAVGFWLGDADTPIAPHHRTAACVPTHQQPLSPSRRLPTVPR